MWSEGQFFFRNRSFLLTYKTLMLFCLSCNKPFSVNRVWKFMQFLTSVKSYEGFTWLWLLCPIISIVAKYNLGKVKHKPMWPVITPICICDLQDDFIAWNLPCLCFVALLLGKASCKVTKYMLLATQYFFARNCWFQKQYGADKIQQSLNHSWLD